MLQRSVAHADGRRCFIAWKMLKGTWSAVGPGNGLELGTIEMGI